MSISSNFYLVNEAKLKSSFEKIGNNTLLKALEMKQWQEIIDDEIQKTDVEGFLEIPKNDIFNRSISQTLYELTDNKSDWHFEKFSAGNYISKEYLVYWLDYVLALCKRFYEYKTQETLWELFDLEVDEHTTQRVAQQFEFYADLKINYDGLYVIDYAELALNYWKMFYDIKKKALNNEVDYLVFYYSY
jgi:hypothetical protein